MVRNKLSALHVAGMMCLFLLTGLVQAAEELAKPVRIGVLAYRGVEQAALGGLRELDVVVDVHARIGLRTGVAPRGNVVARGHDEGAEAQLS